VPNTYTGLFHLTCSNNTFDQPVTTDTAHTRQKIVIGYNFCMLSEQHLSQDTDRKLHLTPESTERSKPHHFAFSILGHMRFCDRKHKVWTYPTICVM